MLSVFIIYFTLNMTIKKQLKYGFYKKSLRKNATLRSWTIFLHKKVAFFRSDFLQNPYFKTNLLIFRIYWHLNVNYTRTRMIYFHGRLLAAYPFLLLPCSFCWAFRQIEGSAKELMWGNYPILQCTKGFFD